MHWATAVWGAATFAALVPPVASIGYVCMHWPTPVCSAAGREYVTLGKTVPATDPDVVDVQSIRTHLGMIQNAPKTGRKEAIRVKQVESPMSLSFYWPPTLSVWKSDYYSFLRHFEQVLGLAQ
ncbi:hypothetical protein DFJ77DRAFT_521675 [Powellomyces hirtus]|nr:hypothetical protein DFJ77DRAFT_521675 [Powellomyces hirtus]